MAYCHLRHLPTKVQNLQKEVAGCSTLIQELTAKVEEQDKELNAMKKEVKLLLSELGQAKHDLKDIANELNFKLETKQTS